MLSMVTAKVERLLHGLLFALLLAWPLLALGGNEVTESETSGKEVAEVREDEEEGGGVEIPIAEDRPSKGVVFNNISELGVRESRLAAESMVKVSGEGQKFRLTKVRYEIYPQEPDSKSGTVIVETDVAVIDQETGILTTESEVTITRKDLYIWGERMQFDTNTGNGTILGDALTVIFDVSDLQTKKDRPKDG